MSDWCSGLLEDYLERITYGFTNPMPTTRSGPYMVTARDINHGRILYEQARSTSEEAFLHEITDKSRPDIGDVLVTKDGTLGRIAIVDRANICINQSIALLKPSRRIRSQFLRYLLEEPRNYARMLGDADGTTIKHIYITRLAKMPVSVPSIATQDAVVGVLGALDTKIDLNRRMNETLEAMARAIFNNWLDGHGAGLDRLQVSELIANGMLLIGDGYRAKNSELFAPGLPFIRAGELNNGFDTQGADVLCERSLAYAGVKISKVGDVAFTSKGTIGRFARVTDRTPKFVYSPQVCFWRSLDHRRLRPSILYAWMVSEDLKAQIDAVAGQTDMAPYVSLRDQRTMMMPEFGATQNDVADQIDSLLALHDANSAESTTLGTIRDLLLPKLMSGEIRVKDAEKIAQMAA